MISLLCFLISGLSPLVLKFVGDVSFGVILTYVLIWKNKGHFKSIISLNLVRNVLIFLFLYFFFFVIADLYSGSKFIDFSKEWIKVINLFFGILALFSVFFIKENDVGYFLRGMFLSFFLSFLAPTYYAKEFCTKGFFSADCFKWLWCEPLMFSILFSLGFLKLKKNLKLYIMIGLSVFCLFMNYRSLGLMLFVSYLISFSCFYFPLKSKNVLSFIVRIGFCILGLNFFSSFYQFGASSGILGEVSYEKFIAQSDASGNFDVNKGRRESAFYMKKIYESPLFGHGSYLRDLDFVLTLDPHPRTDLVPTHSYIGSAWLSAGFFGGFFWIIIIWIILRNLIYLRSSHLGGYTFLFVYMSASQIWSIIFSPLGGSTTIFVSFVIVWNLIVGFRIGYNRIFQIVPKFRY